MSKLVFINAFAGKSKDKQKPFNKVTVASVNDDGTVRVVDMFTDGGAVLSNQDALRFGDIVKPSYRESDIPCGRPSLTGLEVIQNSPYTQN